MSTFEALEHRAVAAAEPADRPRTLLLVDDEENVLAALKRLFRRDGYTILTAASGVEGLARLAEAPVDVIVSDQRMPGMSGVDFLRQAKILYPDTVRLTLSGYADLQSIIDAVNEGAVVKFLTKPWDDQRLREHIAQAFRQKLLADENRRLSEQIAVANAQLEAVNGQLQAVVSRQREQAVLMQASASGVHELLDRLPVVVLAMDPSGALVSLNQAAEAWLPPHIWALGEDMAPELRAVLSAWTSPDVRQVPPRTVHCAGRDWWAWWRAIDHDGGQTRGTMLVLQPRGGDAP